MEVVKGTLERITYHDAVSGFTVATLRVGGAEKKITVVGNMPMAQEGETVMCEGNWRKDPTYGEQFQVAQYQVAAPDTLQSIKQYLSSGQIPGIGAVYAERIVRKFGLDTLKIMDANPNELLKVEGIGAKRLALIKNYWQDHRSIRHIMIYLQQFGITPTFAQKIYKFYGNESIERIETDPYQLATDIQGIGFRIADHIATKVGIAKGSPRRIEAGIAYALEEESQNGHTCLPLQAFIPKAAALLNVTTDVIVEVLHSPATTLQHIIASVEPEGADCIWHARYYIAERGIAKELNRLIINASHLNPSDDLALVIQKAQIEMELHLAALQYTAVEASLQEKVHIITGGPGTGKSTITKVILHILAQQTDRILLAAPTGKAAKRLYTVTGKEAQTIHSLLEYDYTAGGFRRNEKNPLNCFVLIVDEASMIDTLLMHALLRAVPYNAKLILIGDIDQLPSVGAGNVLKDLIFSEKIPVTRLTEVFRQAASSQIIINAHLINNGIVPDLKINRNSDFFFLEKPTPAEIVETICELVERRLPNTYLFDKISDIQVLSPMRKGEIGTHVLNEKLQMVLKSSEISLQKNAKMLYLYDKVMQIQNNYDKGIYNGDVGRIISIDEDEQSLVVEYDQKNVVYEYSELDQIVLAYAVSIHKYQGSESPCVVIPVHTSHYKMLHRNLLYTGVTRGKRLVILVGTRSAVELAVRSAHSTRRMTGLLAALRTFITPPDVVGERIESKSIIVLPLSKATVG